VVKSLKSLKKRAGKEVEKEDNKAPVKKGGGPFNALKKKTGRAFRERVERK